MEGEKVAKDKVTKRRIGKDGVEEEGAEGPFAREQRLQPLLPSKGPLGPFLLYLDIGHGAPCAEEQQTRN